MTDEPLPSFRYHPDPVGTGAFERHRSPCRSCGEVRGWVYAVVPSAVDDLRDALCPWCIADGRAAERFDATFTDVDDAPDGVSQRVLDEVIRRTPGFAAWQAERWLFHCDDAAAFLGAAGWSELAHLPDAVESLRAEVTRWGWPAEVADDFVTSLDVDGEPTAYLFRCLHCHTHLAYADLG